MRQKVTEYRRASTADLLISEYDDDLFKLSEVAEILQVSTQFLRKILTRLDAPQPSRRFRAGKMTVYLYSREDLARLDKYCQQIGIGKYASPGKQDGVQDRSP